MPLVISMKIQLKLSQIRGLQNDQIQNKAIFLHRTFGLCPLRTTLVNPRPARQFS